MDLAKLRVEHTIINQQLDVITAFLNDKHLNGVRANIIDLKQKLRIGKDATIERLCTWVMYCNSQSTKQVYKLCVFYGPQHKAPEWFNTLPLNQVDTMLVRQASGRLDLPPMSHGGTMYDLINSIDGGKEELIREIKAARGIVVNALFCTGFIPDGTEPQLEVTVNRPYAWLGGNTNNSEQLGDVELSHSWGYLTYPVLDKLKENPNTADDLQILRGVWNTNDNVVERRKIKKHVRSLIKMVTEGGLLFVGVRESYKHAVNADRQGLRNHVTPVLIFVSPNELGIAIKVGLDKYTTADKWVLDR